uniref:Leucine-rich repeat-containing N-terminal plant-type domain-containing protein n=1 Tax=Aegilops tauschii subsp. strangulata TaxID=200361 RepID=A0A453BI75_AEGTS
MPAAHRSLPSPPPLATAALLAVFQRWGLRYGLTVNPGRPCGTRDWIYSFAQNASVDCSCDGSPVCRITHLNITGFWNLTEIPLELFNLTELVSL